MYTLHRDAPPHLHHAKVDYCNAILNGSPQYLTDMLQHVLNAAVHLITSSCKYDHCRSELLHDKLHRLDVPQHIQYT